MRFLAGTLNIKLKQCHMPTELKTLAQYLHIPILCKELPG